MTGQDESERLIGIESEKGQQITGAFVEIGLGGRLPGDGRTELVAHKLDIAFDGAGRNFKFAGESDGIRTATIAKPAMNPDDTGEHGPAAIGPLILPTARSRCRRDGLRGRVRVVRHDCVYETWP